MSLSSVSVQLDEGPRLGQGERSQGGPRGEGEGRVWECGSLPVLSEVEGLPLSLRRSLLRRPSVRLAFVGAGLRAVLSVVLPAPSVAEGSLVEGLLPLSLRWNHCRSDFADYLNRARGLQHCLAENDVREVGIRCYYAPDAAN
jgi:hypothetical protein